MALVMARAFVEADPRDVLPQIQVPTLLLCGGGGTAPELGRCECGAEHVRAVQGKRR